MKITTKIKLIIGSTELELTLEELRLLQAEISRLLPEPTIPPQLPWPPVLKPSVWPPPVITTTPWPEDPQWISPTPWYQDPPIVYGPIDHTGTPPNYRTYTT